MERISKLISFLLI